MTTASTASLTFTRSLQAAGWGTKTLAVLIGSILIAVAAQYELPMFPVPMTMQTFAVLVIGALYGPRLGAVTVMAYLLEGVLGLPVYAGGANLAALVASSYTAGYLVGFLPAAFLTGWIVERLPGLLGAVLAVLAGSIVIYAFGLPWLAYMLGGDMAKAVAVGATPFLIGDLVKAALAVAVREGLGRVRIGH